MDASVSSTGAYQDDKGQKRTSNSVSDRLERENNSHMMDILGQIGIVEFLEQDERLTFIIDLSDSTTIVPGPMHVLFANTALRSRPNLLNMISTGAHQVSAGDSEFRT